MKRIVRFIVFWAIVASVFASCKSTETVTTLRLKNLPPRKIIPLMVQNNDTSFSSLSCKKVGISVHGNNGKGSLRGMLKIINDSMIYISATKVSVPVAKILITPDSLKFVNYLQKSFMLSGLNDLADSYNLNLDFNTIQNLLSYQVFKDFDEEKKSEQYKDYISYIEDGKYVLQSAKMRKVEKVLKKTEKKKEIRQRFLSGYQIVRRVYVNPETYLTEAISLVDYVENREVWIRFSDFHNDGDKKFPGKIEVIAKKSGDTMELELSFGKVTFNKDEKIIFKIPNKYQHLSKVSR